MGEKAMLLHTFSRSILASAPMRVSRMRLTIHFSPSSRERLRRSDRSLFKIPVRQCDHPNKTTIPNINRLVNPAICLANQVPRIIQKFIPEFSHEKIVGDYSHSQCQLSLSGFKIEFDI